MRMVRRGTLNAPFSDARHASQPVGRVGVRAHPDNCAGNPRAARRHDGAYRCQRRARAPAPRDVRTPLKFHPAVSARQENPRSGGLGLGPSSPRRTLADRIPRQIGARGLVGMTPLERCPDAKNEREQSVVSAFAQVCTPPAARIASTAWRPPSSLARPLINVPTGVFQYRSSRRALGGEILHAEYSRPSERTASS